MRFFTDNDNTVRMYVTCSKDGDLCSLMAEKDGKSVPVLFIGLSGEITINCYESDLVLLKEMGFRVTEDGVVVK